MLWGAVCVTVWTPPLKHRLSYMSYAFTVLSLHVLRVSVSATLLRFYSNQGVYYRFWPFEHVKAVLFMHRSHLFLQHAVTVRNVSAGITLSAGTGNTVNGVRVR